MKPIVRSIIFALCLFSVAVLSRCGGSHQTAPPLTISPASLLNGTLGAAYSQTMQAGGGVAPFSWSVSVALPHNLQLVPGTGNTATISGTPDTAAQAITFSIKVTDSANQSATQSYTISILAEADTLSFSPAAGLAFSPQLLGTASAPQTATLNNTGSSPVMINSVATVGDFSQNNNCNVSLAPGANCTIRVTFTPSQLGPRTGQITVNDDTVGTPHLLSLTSTGLSLGPNASLSASSLNFGNQVVGTTSAPQSITLSDYGTASLNIADIAATINFGETNTCDSSLTSGASCTINVTFTPSAAGSVTGTLSVTDNASGSPQTVPLSGTCCIPQGGACYGPGPNHCCPAPRGHHSFCSNPTGWGTCTED